MVRIVSTHESNYAFACAFLGLVGYGVCNMVSNMKCKTRYKFGILGALGGTLGAMYYKWKK